MSSVVVCEETINVGQETTIEAPSPNAPFAAVFEDDGETAYFYGLDLSLKDQRIVDARHIYDVENVTDRNIPSVVNIVWSADGMKTALLINDFPHAVIDFQSRRAYCQTAFPPPSAEWSEHDAVWDDDVVKLFNEADS